MIVAAHQPNYLPWLGFFYKIAHCDVFVVLDDVQLTTNSYQNRTRIKSPAGPMWVTQPIIHSGRAYQLTNRVEFDFRVDWRTKHLKTFTANYAKAKHGAEILRLCREWLAPPIQLLAETNIRLIREIAALLGMHTEIVLSSQLHIHAASVERLIEICRRFGADTYLSGLGASDYQRDSQFENANVRLIYSDFVPPEYPQVWGDFCPGLSVIDALFNIGAEATTQMLRRSTPSNHRSQQLHT